MSASNPPPSTNPKRRIGKRDVPFIAAACGLLVVAVLFAAVASSYRAANEWVHHTVVVHHAAERWLASLLDAETRMRGYVVSGQPEFLESHSAALRVERERAAHLRELVQDNPVQAKNVETTERDVQAAVEHQRELVALVHAGHRDEAVQRFSSGESKRDLDAIRDDVRHIRDDEALLLAERRSGVETRSVLLLAVAFAVVLVSFGVLAVAWRSRKHRETMLDRAARDARARLQALSEVAVALASVRTRDQVADVVVGEGRKIAEADTCTLYMLDDTGSVLRLLGVHGIAEGILDRLQRLSASDADPTMFRNFQEGRTLWAENDADYLALVPSLAKAKATGQRAHAFWSVPLVAEGRPVGLLGMGFYAPRTFSPDYRAFIETLAHQSAQALLRAARLERERTDRAWREFLAKAGAVLVSSLDRQEVLEGVVRLAVPAFADWCAIDLVTAGTETPHEVAVAHVDPRKERLAREMREKYPPRPDAPKGAAAVIRTGRSELFPEVAEGVLAAVTADDEHLQMVRQLVVRSVMIVPLRGRNRSLGSMTFVYGDSDRRYTEEDLEFAEDFARRVAMALENALSLREVEVARAEERNLRNAAEIASRAKDEFLAMVSHELRTPLTAILGWAVTLRELGARADVERGLAVIERNARSQTKLIEDVLDVSRIISGKLALTLAPTDVGEVVTTAVETVLPAAGAKEIEIVVDALAPALSLAADADRLQQIVWNLVSNAVKFTPAGGKVRVTVRRQGGEAVIVVTDSGEGIPEEMLPFVFEPFRQADQSTTRRHGGLGLGLAIVKQLVTAHGGTVAAESAGKGQGATFTVRLPARARPASAGAETPDSGRGATSTDPGKLDGVTVLVVDDDDDARELVRSVLGRTGAVVHSAASASQGLALFERVRPTVIVSDIGMPGMDGYAFMRDIRKRPTEAGGSTLAIALTAYARPDDVAWALAAGFQRHLAKPVEPRDLVAAVAALAVSVTA